MAELPDWLAALARPETYPHPVRDIQRIETHLSWVFLTGEWAYKLKKPVKLPFVDFSTLEKRFEACQAELRLNRRTVPGIYDDVVALVDTERGPRLTDTGIALEYAVRMRQFPQSDVLLHLAEARSLTSIQVDHLARSSAGMHAAAAVAPLDSTFGAAETIRRYTAGCLPPISAISLPVEERRLLENLRQWTDEEASRLDRHFQTRRETGFVRECHGDLHLGNIVLVDGVPQPFDCLEFNSELRMIDVVSDLAFVVMDLIDHGVPEFSWQLLNGWLEQTGDFQGPAASRYYQVYRALVRAKVAAIRLAQPGLQVDEVAASQIRLSSYLALASRLSQPGESRLILMHGLSGSGKSFVARGLAGELGAVCIRSDVERKRNGSSRSPNPPQYSTTAIADVYRQVLDSARTVLGLGLPVIIDATFLNQANRRPFAELAAELGIPWAIVRCEADDAILEQRIHSRQSQGGDPSDATVEVLQMQRDAAEPLAAAERANAVHQDTSTSVSWRALAEAIVSIKGSSRSTSIER